MKPDAVIKIRLKTTSEGGRQGPLAIARREYGCVLLVNDEAFDCRFLVEDQLLELGGTYEIPIKFLCPELVLPKLSAATQVTIWEGKTIGVGEIVRLVP